MSKLIKTLRQKYNNWRNPDNTEDIPLSATTRVIDTRDSFTTLTTISGIGPSKAIRFQTVGIHNVEQLIELDEYEVSRMTGYTVRVCKKYIDCGRKLLS